MFLSRNFTNKYALTLLGIKNRMHPHLAKVKLAAHSDSQFVCVYSYVELNAKHKLEIVEKDSIIKMIEAKTLNSKYLGK